LTKKIFKKEIEIVHCIRKILVHKNVENNQLENSFS